jgi:hypothetical protein
MSNVVDHNGEAGRRYNSAMYVIAIGWLYVTLLMALTEQSIVAGVLSFVFYGLLPMSLFAWLFGGPGRRRRRQQNREADSEVAANDLTDQPDRRDPESNQ